LDPIQANGGDSDPLSGGPPESDAWLRVSVVSIWSLGMRRWAVSCVSERRVPWVRVLLVYVRDETSALLGALEIWELKPS
jgi:hypothetical protein